MTPYEPSGSAHTHTTSRVSRRVSKHACLTQGELDFGGMITEASVDDLAVFTRAQQVTYRRSYDEAVESVLVLLGDSRGRMTARR